MVFDIGNGLSEMGKNIAQTAQAWTLEAQKADLEKEKVVLADQLAGAREEKHRGFLTSERESTQTFQSGENEKTRANHLDVAKIGLEGHKISAGASIASANIHADTVMKQIAAENARATAFQPNPDGTMSMVNKVDGKITPLVNADGTPAKFKDPDLAKAQLEAVRATSTQLSDLQRKYQTDVVGPRQALIAVQKDMTLVGPAKEQAIKAAREEVERVEKIYKPEFDRLNGRLENLSNALIDKAGLQTPTVPPGSPTVVPDLNKYLKPPTKAPTGMIDTPIVE